jgi:phenylalanyl-tRNA synthetase alpha chain
MSAAPVSNDASAEVDLEQLLLTHLESNPSIEDTWLFAQSINVDHQSIVGVLKSLLVDNYVLDEPLSTTFWTLTEEGNTFAENGTPEYQVR